MARYSAFLGRRVEVQYRAGDILLPASGTFVADSGRSIFLEEHFQIHVEDDELVPDNLDSVNKLAQYVRKKKS